VPHVEHGTRWSKGVEIKYGVLVFLKQIRIKELTGSGSLVQLLSSLPYITILIFPCTKKYTRPR
jgi:hypothetical protein